jgi:hypothetical protein
MARHYKRKTPLLPWALSPGAASDSLDVPLRIIKEAIYVHGTLPAYLIGNRVRIPTDALLAWVKTFPRATILSHIRRKESK